MTDFLKREFDLGCVLTITARTLLSNRGYDGMMDIIGYMSGDPDLTSIGWRMHFETVRDTILEQHPQLRDLEFPNIEHITVEENRAEFCKDWVDEQKKQFGDKIEIKPTKVAVQLSFEEEMDYMKSKNPDMQILTIDPEDPDTPVTKYPKTNPPRNNR